MDSADRHRLDMSGAAGFSGWIVNRMFPEMRKENTRYIMKSDTSLVYYMSINARIEARTSRIYDENGRTRTGENYDRIYRWRNKRYCFWFFGWHCWYSAVGNATTYDTPYDYHSVTHYISERIPITLPNNGGTWDSWSRNKIEWGRQNHYTYFTPWDIYTVKRRYGIAPNRRPSYTPAPSYP